MTSLASRADVESVIWRFAGRVQRQDMEKILRVVDAYAVTVAHKLPPPPERKPEGKNRKRVWGDLYLCKRCQDRLPIDRFPEAKRRNPILSYHCLGCQGMGGR